MLVAFLELGSFRDYKARSLWSVAALMGSPPLYGCISLKHALPHYRIQEQQRLLIPL